jgi:hypothetical protein
MAKKRENLRFDSVNAIITDVERLKKGHVAVGKWTLPQVSWHLGLAPIHCLRPLAPDARSTPEQVELKRNRLDPLLASGSMPPAIPIAKGTDPLSDGKTVVTDADVDNLLAALRTLDAWPHPNVEFTVFGIITIDEFRTFTRLHAANHLSNFVPV